MKYPEMGSITENKNISANPAKRLLPTLRFLQSIIEKKMSINGYNMLSA